MKDYCDTITISRLCMAAEYWHNLGLELPDRDIQVVLSDLSGI